MASKMVEDFIRENIHGKDMDTAIREYIEYFSAHMTSEEEEKANYLAYGSFEKCLEDIELMHGSTMYGIAKTMAASAFAGDDELFHKTYVKSVEKFNELSELLNKDFELCKKLFLDFFTAPVKVVSNSCEAMYLED